MNVVIGIDVGGSTTKIVGYTENLTEVGFLCVTAKDPVTSVYGALGRFVSENTLSLTDIAHIILTGVGASHFEGDIYNIATTRVTEFEAIGRGGLHLAGKDKALVVSMGTGTAFVRADKNEIKHIGGSGVGGGTLIGLCGKLAGCTNFDSIVTLANDADLQKVDLTVGDISKNSIGKLDAAVTASNFGKLEDSATGGDLALGVLNMVFQ
ncbi:MAG: pantothenate kinase, partial [Oscillospiraceae bacterium]